VTHIVLFFLYPSQPSYTGRATNNGAPRRVSAQPIRRSPPPAPSPTPCTNTPRRRPHTPRPARAAEKSPTEKQNNPQPFRRFALYGFFLKLDVKMEIQNTSSVISLPCFCKNLALEILIPQSSTRYPMVLHALSLRIGRAIQWIATPKPLTARCKTNG